MVRLVQLAEHQIVVLGVVGSSPTSHPNKASEFPKLFFVGVRCGAAIIYWGPNPPDPLSRGAPRLSPNLPGSAMPPSVVRCGAAITHWGPNPPDPLGRGAPRTPWYAND